MAVPVRRPGRGAPHEDILTLAEAAAYLRVPESAVEQLATAEEIPARKIGGEWRLLRQALEDWLRCPDRRPADKAPEPGSKRAVLRHAGIFREDDDLEERLADARARRGAGG